MTHRARYSRDDQRVGQVADRGGDRSRGEQNTIIVLTNLAAAWSSVNPTRAG
jgi:hypothetical protein